MDNTSCTCSQELYCNTWIAYIGISVNCCALGFSVLTFFAMLGDAKQRKPYWRFLDLMWLLEAAIFLIHCSFNLSRFGQYAPITKDIDTAVLGIAYSVSLSSTIHMTAIAIDHYIYTLKPLYYISHMTRCYVPRSLLIAWAAALVHAVIPATVYRKDKFHTSCILINPPVVILVLTVIYFVVFAAIICICNFIISGVAFERNKALNTRRLQQSSSNDICLSKANIKSLKKGIHFLLHHLEL